jgi:hypothetical protein
MKTYNLNILGSKWKLKVVPRYADPMFETVDGYADRSIRTMFVAEDSAHTIDDLKDWSEYQKVVKRHEIIHAYFFESGLAQDMYHPAYGHCEQSIDFFAIQFPKMIETFKKADAL